MISLRTGQDIFALPAIEFSDFHLQEVINNDFTSLETGFFCHILGNFDTKTGFIHEFTPSEIAERLGCHPTAFYGDRGLIKRLNESNLVKISMENKKICGKVCETPKQRSKQKKRKKPHKLALGMMHRQCAAGLLQGCKSKAVWRVLMWLSFNCDQTTGEINVKIRPVDLAKQCGVHRTAVERAIDFIADNDWGFGSIARDYIITGRLEYVAMAKAFLTRAIADQKAKNAAKNAEQKSKINRIDYKLIETLLYKTFGINATGFMKSLLVEARETLLKPVLPKMQTE